jgi:DNA-directed RNA polymerase subunit RPC12/RpoP
MAQKKVSKRDAYLQRVYGITEKQYQSLLEKQGGGCAICGKTPEEEGKALAVDHVHIRGGGGEVRGVLCSYCNHRIVGRHKDPDLLLRVSKYISQGTGWFTPKARKKSKRKKRDKRRKI